LIPSIDKPARLMKQVAGGFDGRGMPEISFADKVSPRLESATGQKNPWGSEGTFVLLRN
jgi:hypothetical protein